VIAQVRRAKELGLLVMMNTNATLLDGPLSLELLRAGVDDIFFSVDSPYADEYESIRVGADFFRVLDNIRTFVETKDRLGCHHVQTRASMVVRLDDEDSRRAREDYKLLFRSLGVAEIGFGLMTDMKTDYRRKYGRVPGFVCRDPYSRMFVFWDGAVGPCCGEWERGYLLGHAAEDDLADIWHNEKYLALRQAHEQGRYDSIGICRRCSVPWLSLQEVE
jgi:radical SAM protein with 4Fe4S-binding SPASM domain